MNYWLALSGMLPALGLMAYVEKFDAKRPEPRSALRKVALFGGLSTIPCIVVQLMLDGAHSPGTLNQALFTSYVSAGLVEESAKAACLYLAVWRHPAFDERFDGIVYGTRAGLGFALVENVGYLLGAQSMSGFLGIFVMRAVLAVPGHAIWAGFMGHYAAMRRFDKTGPGLAGGLAIAVFMHGTYDAALFSQPFLSPLVAVPLWLVPLAIIVIGYRRLKAHAADAIAKDDIAFARPVPSLPLGIGFLLR
jgi:RsiW-degrading membrane proteinase PrsW (M82 family)